MMMFMKKVAAVSAALLMLMCCFVVNMPSASAAPSEWSAAPPLLENTTDAAVATVGNVAYIFGGLSENYVTPTNASYSYNLMTGAVERLPNMTVSVAGAEAAAGPDGRIYVIGGTHDGIHMVASVQVYDWRDKEWSAGPDMTTGVWNPAVAELDGRIYVMGGFTDAWAATKAVQVLDTATGTWSTVADLPAVRMNGAGASDDDHLYFIGGGPDTGAAASNVYRYDPESDSWSSVASTPTARQAATAVRGADGLIYVAGGDSSWAYNNGGSTAVYFYNPSADEWGAAASLPYSVKYASAAASSDGQIFILGGDNLNTIHDDVASLQVMRSEVVVENDTLAAGGSATVSVYVWFKYLQPEQYYLTPVLRDGQGVPFANEYMSTVASDDNLFYFVTEMPATALAGQYYLDLGKFYVSGPSYSLRVGLGEVPVTVVDSLTVDERLQALSAEVQDLRAQLDDLKAAQNGTTQDISDVQKSVDGKADGMLSYVVIALLVVIVVLLVFMLVARRKG